MPEGGVYRKIAAVMAAVERLPKDKKNEHFKYDYTSEATVKAALRPLCAEHGLVILPSVSRHERDGDLTRLYLDITFVDVETAESHTIHVVGEGKDSQDKGPAKALTLGLKYGLLNSLLIDTGADPDAGEGQATARAAAPRTRAAPQPDGRQRAEAAQSQPPQSTAPDAPVSGPPVVQGDDGQPQSRGAKAAFDALKAQRSRLALSDDDWRLLLYHRYGVKSREDLTPDIADKAARELAKSRPEAVKKYIDGKRSDAA